MGMERVQNFLQAQIDTIEKDNSKKSWQVGLSISNANHERLQTIAKEIEMSKTATATRLLEAAIKDAFDYLGLSSGSEGDEIDE